MGHGYGSHLQFSGLKKRLQEVGCIFEHMKLAGTCVLACYPNEGCKGTLLCGRDGLSSLILEGSKYLLTGLTTGPTVFLRIDKFAQAFCTPVLNHAAVSWGSFSFGFCGV